jgi:hypothetical protein
VLRHGVNQQLDLNIKTSPAETSTQAFVLAISQHSHELHIQFKVVDWNRKKQWSFNQTTTFNQTKCKPACADGLLILFCC